MIGTPALRYGSGRSSLEKPNRWLFICCANRRLTLQRDHLASVRFVTDSTGAVVESTYYAAYGERLNTAMQSQKGFIPLGICFAIA